VIKFLHAADIHLDSPLVGLERYDGAPVEEVRGATRRALVNLVDLALAEEVAFVLVAGDLYDGDWRDYNTGLFLARHMGRLREAGIPVFIIRGNHDAASQITRQLRSPDNVRWLQEQGPETVLLESIGVAIHGQSFASREVTEDMSAAYPDAVPGLFNIGLLHTSVNGREGHEPYAPCSLQGLLSRGYQYWALGHVHKYEVLHDDPWVVFPGNTQGRHARETGPKGCTLVTVEDGMVVSAKRRYLDVMRWCVCQVDATGAATGEEVIDRVAGALQRELDGSEGRALAVRVQVLGPCQAHGDLSADPERWTNEIRAAATELSSGAMWVEKVQLGTQTVVDLASVMEQDSALGGLLRTIGGLEADDDLLASLKEEFADLRRKLPVELRAGDESIELEDPGTLHGVMEEVRQMLLARILAGGGGA